MIATIIGQHWPVIGAPVPAIIMGIVVGLVPRVGKPAALSPGVKFASKFVLQLSVALLGVQVSLAQVGRVGGESLPVMLGTLVGCLVVGWFVGRWLGVLGDLRTMITVGTGICGASAIAATAPVIGAAAVDVAYAVSVIFAFNVTAVVVFPGIGHMLDMSQHAFGLFAGTAVNDTSSVVAAATTYGGAATDYAVVVKLVRTLMIIPICLGLAAAMAHPRSREEVARPSASDESTPTAGKLTALRLIKLIPWFLIVFVLLATVNSFGAIPADWHQPLRETSSFMIATALAAIGLSTDIAGFRRAGWRPLFLGGALWAAVTGLALGLQAVTGHL